MTIHLERPSPDASRDLPGQRAGNRLGPEGPYRPYSVLLPVGFAVPPPLPAARCALTAPFHPCSPACAAKRSDFCGTVPGVAPAGHYPAPCFHGARTFLPRALSGPAAAVIRPAGGKRGRDRRRSSQWRAGAHAYLDLVRASPIGPRQRPGRAPRPVDQKAFHFQRDPPPLPADRARAGSDSSSPWPPASR